jgi:hypothetical protein
MLPLDADVSEVQLTYLTVKYFFWETLGYK